MELVSPEFGVMLWTLFSFLSLGLFLAALIGLMLAENLDSNLKLAWAVIILLIPIIGPILFFIIRRKLNEKKVVSKKSF